MKFKRLIGAGLATVLAMSMIACGAKEQAPADGAAEGEAASQEEQMEAAGIQTANAETGNTEKTDETVTILLSGYPDYFWHVGAANMGTNEEQIVNSCTLDRLVDYDEVTNELKPMLATSWETSEDGKTFTFHLRDDVKMSDGTPLVADDVVYTVNTWIEQCASNDTGKYLEKADKIDDQTVSITFNCSAPESLKLLSWSNFGIVSEDEINAIGGLEAASQNPTMGSGKYKFKEAKVGEYIILERNEDYWDPDYFGYFKTIKFIPVADSNSKVQAVLSGDAQVAYDMPVSQAATFATNQDARTYVYTNGEVEHLFYNMQEGHATSDIRVRQAIQKALDFDAIAQVATAGFGKVAYAYVDESATYYQADETPEDKVRDVEGAKALLAEAGYDESNPLHIVCVTIADQVDLYTVIQANLKEVNVDLEIQQVDMGGFVPAMLFEKSYDIAAIGDNCIFRTPTLSQFVCEGVVFGGPAIVMEDHVALLNTLMEAKDDAAAKEALAAYDAQLKEDTMCTNMYGALKASIVGKDIKGFSVRERAYIDATTLYK